jgi:hypothetical protein
MLPLNKDEIKKRVLARKGKSAVTKRVAALGASSQAPALEELLGPRSSRQALVESSTHGWLTYFIGWRLLRMLDSVVFKTRHSFLSNAAVNEA